MTTLPMQDRFKAETYFSVERSRTRWRWTYEADSGENFMGTAQTYIKAKRMAEKKSGEKIRS